MTTDKLVLIDGHALAYRVFYALPLASFTTKQGEPTNATYGFTRTLLDLLLADDAAHYLAVSFDVGATFRDQLFADYKGTREKMPDELSRQIERIREIVRALNIPILELEGYEADDVLGTAARQAKEKDVFVHIVTGDRDLLQLVDSNTVVELPPGQYEKKPTLYDETAVIEKYGVRPDQFVDYKALVGDSSDNIPGVRGIGAKTAARLLQEHGSLDAIYEQLSAMKGAVQQRLADGRENAYLSRELSRIVTDAPIKLDLTACVAQEYDPDEVIALFRLLEFRSLTDRVLKVVERRHSLLETTTAATIPAFTGPAPTEAILVRTEADLAALLADLAQAPVIAFDVETTSLDERAAELVGISLAVASPRAYYIPVGHLASSAQKSAGQMSLFAGEAELAEGQLPLEQVLAALRPFLTDANLPKIAHNAKYDYAILERCGLAVKPLAFDTMIAEWLTDPASKHLGLKDLARHRLGIEMTEITSLIGRGKGQGNFAEVPIEAAAAYAAADADITLRLFYLLQPEIQARGLERLLRDIEMPLICVLADMEKEGVAIDVDFFRQMSGELQTRLLALERQIHEIAGEPFNINSTQQLSDILFKKLNLPRSGLRKTKSGYYSTAVDVLEGLLEADKSGLIAAIIEQRELVKLKNTYVDALPQMVNPSTGRLHTSFNQTGAVTGRLASSAPNLQNIPIRTDVGQRLRRGFVPRPGWLFLAADYSQVELRILAHITQDEAMLDAFRQGQDIHRTTAAAVYNVPLEQVTFQQRRLAKSVNFGLIYGMGAYRLARESELTLAEAENFITAYFAHFPGIRGYLDRTKKQARDQGFVETLLGRRRYFPIFQVIQQGGAGNGQLEARAEREAINHPIQGTAADIIKIAMIRLHETLISQQYQARLLLQVHDELVLEAPQPEIDAVRTLVIETMSTAFSLDAPLKVEASIGRNWLELKG
jgi:DNA polymerase I